VYLCLPRLTRTYLANKRELVADLVRKAKQLEFLINSLPEPEPIEVQQQRLQQLEDEMTTANQDYLAAVQRARASTCI
jgi:mediator of RNA polymerase II transcription subunit 21